MKDELKVTLIEKPGNADGMLGAVKHDDEAK